MSSLVMICSDTVEDYFAEMMAWQPTCNTGIKYFIRHGMTKLMRIFNDDIEAFWRMASSGNQRQVQLFIENKIKEIKKTELNQPHEESMCEQQASFQFGSNLFHYVLTPEIIEVKSKLESLFAGENMPHDWQIYAAFCLVELQTILNIPTGFGKSHVLSTAAFIIAS